MHKATYRAPSSHAQVNGRAPHGVADVPRRPQRQAATEQPKPTLVFFYTTTSGDSRRAEGFLAQVLQRRRNHQTFTLGRIEYEAHAELAARLGVKQAPAIVVLEGKRVRARLEPPRGCADIEVTLAPWLR